MTSCFVAYVFVYTFGYVWALLWYKLVVERNKK